MLLARASRATYAGIVTSGISDGQGSNNAATRVSQGSEARLGALAGRESLVPDVPGAQRVQGGFRASGYQPFLLQELFAGAVAGDFGG